MKQFLMLLMVLSFSFISCNDNPVAPTTGSILIKVIDQGTNLPIKNVLVSTTPASEFILSNDSGIVVIKDLMPNTYTIHTSQQNYVSTDASVYVAVGKTIKATILLPTKKSVNRKPNKPILISPINNFNLITGFINLKWTCSDPDEDSLVYNIYYGHSIDSLEIIKKNYDYTDFEIKTLENKKDYYWKIEAIDTYDNRSESSIYKFSVDTSNIKLDNRVIAYFNFNSNINNSISNAIYAASSYAEYGNDRFNKQNNAIYFTSQDSYVVLPNHNQLNLGPNFSICLWIKPNSSYGTTNDEDNIMLAGRWGGTGLNASSFGCLINTMGYPKLFAYTNGVSYTSLKATKQVQLNTWTHLVYVFDRNVGKIYMNGELVASGNIVVPQNSNYNLFLGGKREFGANQAHFNGAMDDFTMYNTALSEDEIKELAK